MKYPDEWSGASLRLALAVVLVVVGLFNIFVWFARSEHPPLWWLAPSFGMVAFGTAAAVAWYVRRRDTSDS